MSTLKASIGRGLKGSEAYCLILKTLREAGPKGMLRIDVARKSGVNDGSARRVVDALFNLGMVSAVKRDPTHKDRVTFAYGVIESDVRYVPAYYDEYLSLKFKEVWDIIEANPGITPLEVIALSSTGEMSVRKTINHLRKYGFVRAKAWTRNHHNSPWEPSLEMGRGRDADKPKPIPNGVSAKAYIRRKRQLKEAANLGVFGQLIRMAA